MGQRMMRPFRSQYKAEKQVSPVHGDEGHRERHHRHQKRIEYPYSASREYLLAPELALAVRSEPPERLQHEAVIQLIAEQAESHAYEHIRHIAHVHEHGERMAVVVYLLYQLGRENAVAALDTVRDEVAHRQRHRQQNCHDERQQSPEPHPPVCEVDGREYEAYQVEGNASPRVLHPLEYGDIVNGVRPHEVRHVP